LLHKIFEVSYQNLHNKIERENIKKRIWLKEREGINMRTLLSQVAIEVGPGVELLPSAGHCTW
jgi:hypothetical protein